MSSELLVLFGNPGCGKNFVGEILACEFGYKFVDLDIYLYQNTKMMEYLQKGIQPTEEARIDFVDSLTKPINNLLGEFKKLVVAQHFVKEYMRQRFLRNFPQSVWILIECEESIRQARVLSRIGRKISSQYDVNIIYAFEQPLLSHQILVNNASELEIINSFAIFLKSLQ